VAEPKVSIAICTWNRSNLLRNALQSLAQMSVPIDADWEVLAINNNSTDQTETVIATFSKVLPIRSIFVSEAGLSNARNRALSEARGTHILFTDDDVIVEADWLGAFIESARRHPEAAAFGGPIRPLFDEPPDPMLAQAFPIVADGFCAIDHNREEGPLPNSLPVWGANMGFCLDAVAGYTFDPSFGDDHGTNLIGGDDARFMQCIRRNNGIVIWCPSMVVNHYVDPARIQLSYLRRYTIGRTRGQLRCEGTVFPGMRIFGAPRWLWKQMLVSYFMHFRFRLAGNKLSALIFLRECWKFRGMLMECRSNPKSEFN
jgi:glycosyltransferase involved in cell wall biosynthesis